MTQPQTDDGLLRRLSTDEDRVPRADVDEIVRRPHLLPRLAALIDNEALWTAHDERNWAPIHATFIVAAMQGPGALDVLLRALHHSAENEETVLMEVADSMLASFGPDAVPALLAAFERAASYPRIWIDDALARIAEKNPAFHETVRAHLRQVALQHKEKEVALCAAQNFVAFAKPDDRETLEILIDRKLLDPEDLEDVLAGDADLSVPPPLDWLKFYDPDAIDARRQDYREADEEDAPDEIPDSPALDVLSRLDDPGAAPAPIVNESPKVGRNAPCPCGSGKKFKKCCAI